MYTTKLLDFLGTLNKGYKSNNNNDMAYVVYHFHGATKKTVWHQEATLSDAVTTMRSLCMGCVTNVVKDEFFDVEFCPDPDNNELRDRLTIFANFRRIISATASSRHNVSKMLDTMADEYANYVAHCPTNTETAAHDTFAVVSQDGSKKAWVSGTSDFETTLALYDAQRDDADPQIDPKQFTYSFSRGNSWTGIIRDPEQAKHVVAKKTNGTYKNLVLYHVDSGQNAPLEPLDD